MLLLWASAAVFFWPVLFGGMSLLLRDTTSIYLPQTLYTLRAWAHGRPPLWEPTIGLGYPFQSDPHSMAFYPLAPLLAIFPLVRSYNLFVACHVPLMGTFTYLLLRRWRLARSSAMLGAAVTMFSGYTISCTNLTTLLRGSTWAPLAMLAFDGYLQTGGWRPLLAAALTLAVQGSGTDPQYTMFTGLLMALEPWLRPLPRRVELHRWASGLAVCWGIAAALLAYQYAPLAQLIGQSDRTGGLSHVEIGGYDIPPGQLWNLAVPLPYALNEASRGVLNYAKRELPFYVDLLWGVPVLALALSALGWRRGPAGTPEPERAGFGRAAAAVWALTGSSLVLSLGYQTPLFPLLMFAVPPLKAFRYAPKYFLLVSLGLGLLAAIGYEGIRSGVEACSRLFARTLAWSLLALGVGGTGLAVASAPPVWQTTVALTACVTLAAWIPLVLARERRLLPGVSAGIVGVIAVANLALATHRGLAVADARLVEERPWTCDRLAPALAGHGPGARPGDPFFGARDLEGHPPPRYDTRYSFKPTHTSVAPLPDLFLSSLRGSLFGLDCVINRLSVDLEANSALTALFSKEPDPASNRCSRRLAAALGATRSIEFASDAQSVSAPDRILATSGPVAVVELGNVVPRAFIAARAKPAPADLTLPTTEALLALPGEALFRDDGAGSPEALVPRKVRRCAFASYRPEALSIDFDLEGRGLLVVLDAYYPGWRARVDGKERPILKVDGLVRGVRVEQGEHRLEMTFEPLPFRIGCAISVFSLVLVLCGLLLLPGPVPAPFAGLSIPTEKLREIAKSDWVWKLLPWAAALLLFRPAILGAAVLYFRDTLGYRLPEARLTAAAWRSLELPLWEPGISMGYAFHSDPASLAFYPPALLLAVLPFPAAYGVFIAAHVCLAGGALLALLRRWGLGWPPSAAGACALMFSGWTVAATAGGPTLRALAWAPLVLLAFDRFLESGSSSRLVWVSLALAAEGAGTSAGHVLATVGLVALAAILRPVRSRAGRAIRGTVAATALAALLLAVRWLPMLEHLREQGAYPVGVEEQSVRGLDLANLWNLALPLPFPDPSSSYFAANHHVFALPGDFDLYWGLPALAAVLASLGWIARPAKPAPFPPRMVLAWAALALVAFGAALLDRSTPEPTHSWVGTLSASQASYLAPLALAVLTALGVEGLYRGHRTCTGLHRGAVAAGVLGCLAILAAVALTRDKLPELYLFPSGASRAVRSSEFFTEVREAWSRTLLLTIQIPSLIWLLLRRSRSRALPAAAVSALVVLLTVADLVHVADRDLLISKDRRVCKLSPTTVWARPGLPPVAPARLIAYPPNSLTVGEEVTMFDVYRIEADSQLGLWSAPNGFQQIMDLRAPRTDSERALLAILRSAGGRAARDRLAAAMGAEVAFSAEGLGNAPGSGQVLGVSSPVVVRRLANPTPRAFIASRAVPSERGPEAASILALPGTASYAGAAVPRPLEPAAVRGCRIASYRNNSVTIDFDLDGEGLLVLMDSYDPGWAARVDGRERPVLRVAGLFRGVEVRGGEHRLELVYEPASLELGAGISLTALLVVLAVLASSRARREPARA